MTPRRIITSVAVLLCTHLTVFGQYFLDAGFESYAVESGQFTQSGAGPWQFNNDAGVVDPPAPNTSLEVLNTWSATYDPVDGEQYASTYAGADTILQSVTINTPGDYILSVWAASPGGTVTIRTSTLTLQDGGFRFNINGLVGSEQAVEIGSGWVQYSTEFNVASAGDYTVGVRNTRTAPYFINYDAFAITPVPEPSLALWGLLGLGLTYAVTRRRRS